MHSWSSELQPRSVESPYPPPVACELYDRPGAVPVSPPTIWFTSLPNEEKDEADCDPAGWFCQGEKVAGLATDDAAAENIAFMYFPPDLLRLLRASVCNLFLEVLQDVELFFKPADQVEQCRRVTGANCGSHVRQGLFHMLDAGAQL